MILLSISAGGFFIDITKEYIATLYLLLAFKFKKCIPIYITFLKTGLE